MKKQEWEAIIANTTLIDAAQPRSVGTHVRRALRWAVVAAGSMLCVGSIAAKTNSVDEPATPPSSADPNAPFISEDVAPASQLKLLVNKGVSLTTKSPFKRVYVGQPDVADANAIGQNRLLITGKKPGNTQVIVWDDTEKAQVLNVSVQIDIAGLKDTLKEQFPRMAIEAASVNGEIILRGKVPSVTDAEQVAAIAAPYAPKILNYLVVSGGQQVMLSVRFAEVSRTAVTGLGVNLYGTDGRSQFGTNVATGGGSIGSALNAKAPTLSSGVTLFGSGQAGKIAFEYFIDALRNNNLLRTLAEPNLMAMSGQEASFLAGGSIPIPVSQGGSSGGAIAIEYREYGVKLKFTPVILGDGRIRLKVSPEVSDLDYGNSVTVLGTTVPGISQRKVTTTVELAEGQSFALAGLLNTSVAANKNVTPLLGDLPVIGPLFRTVRYQRKDTELVVLVTPYLVEPLNPDSLPRLPGEDWIMPSENEMFMNATLGGPKSKTAPTTGNEKHAAPKFHGEFGFTPVATPSTLKAAPGVSSVNEGSKVSAPAPAAPVTSAATDSSPAASTDRELTPVDEAPEE